MRTFNVVGEGTWGNCKVISIVCRIEIDKKRRKDNEQKRRKEERKRQEPGVSSLLSCQCRPP